MKIFPLVLFYFFDLFNTAITVPESYGLLKGIYSSGVLVLIFEVPPSGDFRRELTLVSKVMQNLANQIVFGQKEAFMVPLNGFIEENIATINKFYSEVTVR